MSKLLSINHLLIDEWLCTCWVFWEAETETDLDVQKIYCGLTFQRYQSEESLDCDLNQPTKEFQGKDSPVEEPALPKDS